MEKKRKPHRQRRCTTYPTHNIKLACSTILVFFILYRKKIIMKLNNGHATHCKPHSSFVSCHGVRSHLMLKPVSPSLLRLFLFRLRLLQHFLPEGRNGAVWLLCSHFSRCDQAQLWRHTGQPASGGACTHVYPLVSIYDKLKRFDAPDRSILFSISSGSAGRYEKIY